MWEILSPKLCHSCTTFLSCLNVLKKIEMSQTFYSNVFILTLEPTDFKCASAFTINLFSFQPLIHTVHNFQVVRALQFLQKGKDSSTSNWEAVSIPRGTLQVC